MYNKGIEAVVKLIYGKYNESSGAKILLLQGKSINDRVYQYRPFVMNTRAELKEALEDYNSTSFGSSG